MTFIARGCAFGASAFAIALAMPVAAQDVAAGPVPVEEAAADDGMNDIVVTARRREESAQRIPVAVTALGPMQLESRSIRSLTDLTSVAPGLRFAGEGNANVSSISLRGLNKIAASSTGTPAVVVYFAEVPLVGEGLNLPTYDLANVQVLKGPQGTLFGRNTIGGAVLVTPAAPSHEFEGYGRVSLGNLDYQAVEGAINIPIVQDKVALRVAGQLRRRDGFVTEINSGSDLQNIHQNSLRGSLLIEPVEGLTNITVVDYFKAKDNGTADIIFRTNAGIPGLEFIDPFVAAAAAAQRDRGLYRVDSAVDNLFTRIKTFGITNTTTFELSDSLTLKNIFGYRMNRLETRGNNDGLPTNPSGFVFYKTLHSLNDDRQFTNELQLQGQAFDDKLDYIVGAFYLKFEPNGNRGNMQNQFNQIFATSSYVKTDTKAVFAQIGYDLSDVVQGLKLNLGARYTWTKQSLCGITNSTVANIDDFFSEERCRSEAAVGGFGRGVLRAKESKPTWTVGLDYQASDNVFLYVASRRGYREGGINGPLFNSPAAIAVGLDRYQTYGAETVTDVEVGAKTDWRSGDVSGRFNIAAFRNWYKDAVNYINVTGSGFPQGDPSTPDRGSFGFNSAKLVISGIEVDGNFSPTPGMVFTFSGAYLDQKVKSVNSPVGFIAPQPTLPSPKWSYGFGVDMTPQTPVLGGDLTFHFDYSWLDDYQVQTGSFPGYKLGNARIDLRNINGGGLGIGVFAKNVFDEEYLASPVIALPQFPTNIGNPGEPRTYGVELNYRF